MATNRPPSAYRCIEARAEDRADAERLAAEAHFAGAQGLEEREDEGGFTLLIYAPEAAADQLCSALRRSVPGARVALPVDVPDTDWSQGWKAGLQAISVSARLSVRPSFVPSEARSGQRELIIDPGQAFGTGGHASTRLILERIDALVPSLGPAARVLDVGTGTGILALAAAALSNAEVFAFDTDPLACSAAQANARENLLGSRVRLFRGTLDAIANVEFDLVVANLLRLELLPLLGGIAARLRTGGRAVLSGLLESETAALAGPIRAAGLNLIDERRLVEPGGEAWSALVTTR